MMEIGKIYKKNIKITDNKIKLFKKITLDNNPIHKNKEIAKKFGFKAPIAYGMLAGSLLSNIIGNKIPGAGALWTDCNIAFSKPVFKNDILSFESKILKISYSTLTLILSVNVYNQNKEKVLDAYSTVKFPKSFLKKIKKSNQNLDKKKISKKKLKPLTLIIGASSDLGLEISNKLLKKRKKLLITYNSGKGKLSKKLINNRFVKSLKLDLKKNKEINKLKRIINNKYSIEGIIFASSGEMKIKSIEKTNQKDIQDEFNIQTIGLFSIIKSLDRDLQKNCSIVVIGSDVVFGKPPPKMLIYNIAKNSLLGLTKSLAVELGYRGIRVNMISPGIFEGKSSSNFPLISKEKYKVESTLNKIASPKNISTLIEFLLSNKSSHLTGTNIRVNAGNSFD